MNGEQVLRSRRGAPNDNDDALVDGQGVSCQKEEEGELFPLAMTLQILGVALVIFTVIPYLGFTIPAAPRTDLPWWQTGMLYQVDARAMGEEKLDSLGALGISAVKLESISSPQPMESDVKMISDIKDYGLNAIITLGPDVFDGIKDCASIVLSSSKLWLDAGAQGVSVHLPLNHGTSLQNMTASLRQLADEYISEDQEFILIMVETSLPGEQAAALAGGADLVTGPSVCAAQSGERLSAVLKEALDGRDDKGQAVYAWNACPANSNQQLLPLMLPGTTIFSSQVMKLLQKDELQITLQQFQSLLPIKAWPSMSWGKHEDVYVTDSIYSMMRWANGKIYDKFVLVMNVADSDSTDNYVLRMRKFSVPQKAKVILSSGKTYEANSIVAMEKFSMKKGESVILQFPPFGV